MGKQMKIRKTLEKNLALEIQPDAEGVFKSRPNRFLGIVDIINTDTVNPYAANTKTVSPEILKGEKVHIQDPGRLEDILNPGNRVLLKKAGNKNRKTKWDLIAGNVGKNPILINSGYHRKIAEWAIKNKVATPFEDVEKIFPEQRFGESRLDFLLEKRKEEGVPGSEAEKRPENEPETPGRMWVEVKGCTLSREGVALFPDAPTSRGKRHVEELRKAVETGDQALLIILIFRPDSKCFAPNREIDPAFAEAFERAVENGVEICPLVFEYEKGKVYFKKQIPLCEQS